MSIPSERVSTVFSEAKSRLSRIHFEHRLNKLQKDSQQTIQAHIALQLKLISVTLVNARTFLPQATILLNDGLLDMKQMKSQDEINLKLGNFQVLDLSNYPKSLIAEKDYDQIVPVRIFGVGGKRILLDIDVVQYHQPQ